MRLTGVLAILLTVVAVPLTGVILLNERVVTLDGIEMPAVLSTPAGRQALIIVAVVLLCLWGGTALAGVLLLLRKGAFARPIRGFAEAPWACCFGIILLWWTVFVVMIPGPFLLWYADTRRGLPRCPECRGWVPPGATVCPDCGTAIETPPAAAPAVPPAAGKAAAPTAGLARGCAQCGSETAPGALYTYYYGTFQKTEYMGRSSMRQVYRVGGSEDVFLCHSCVDRCAQQFARRGGLIGLILALAVPVLIAVPDLLRGKPLVAVLPAAAVYGGIFLAVILFLYLRLRREAKKHPERSGDALALRLRKAARQREGYTRFFTREQYRAMGGRL